MDLAPHSKLKQARVILQCPPRSALMVKLRTTKAWYCTLRIRLAIWRLCRHLSPHRIQMDGQSLQVRHITWCLQSRLREFKISINCRWCTEEIFSLKQFQGVPRISLTRHKTSIQEQTKWGWIRCHIYSDRDSKDNRCNRDLLLLQLQDKQPIIMVCSTKAASIMANEIKSPAAGMVHHQSRGLEALNLSVSL